MSAELEKLNRENEDLRRRTSQAGDLNKKLV
jgi:hypothetical protein